LSIPARPLRAILERLKDPLWLPLLCAAAAYLAWQASALGASREVLVPLRSLSAGTMLSPSLVKSVRWEGPLPSAPLKVPSGALQTSVPAGMPILTGEVGPLRTRRTAALRPILAVPSSALLSLPPVAPGTDVSVYATAPGTLPQLVCASALVAPGSSQQNLVLAVPASSLGAMLVAITAGRLIVVAHPR
jgi:hypothetical protein